MATTLKEIRSNLDSLGIKYQEQDGRLGIFFTTERYRDAEGNARILLVLQLDEDGRYFSLFSLGAFRISGRHVDAFLRACSMVQWETKLVQFEYRADTGEVRPTVEFPLEDGTLTALQLKRCILGLVGLVDEYYPTLQRALAEGIVSMPRRSGPAVQGVRRALHEALQELTGDSTPEAKSRAEQIKAILTSMHDVEQV